ncbi:MAG: 23S rRNA (adenine(2503)-C(2))-methyltransferase RlmN [Elusimicrobiota bacterium]|jgi:23S rRNA (adenine2503-C2)-methyltransferase|nr:23S rRNA (adenine(2503)-C(2))-methyltransferase RlmN [Elusimicrobiota bacterium]
MSNILNLNQKQAKILKKNIKNFSLTELQIICEKLKIPKYKAKQIFSWIYKKGAKNFEQMSDIQKDIRLFFDNNFKISVFEKVESLNSDDGTIKYLFELSDKNVIETVVISSKKRKTLCISSQVGCKMACVFCASGMMKFKRNLDVAEIIEQIWYIKFIENIEIDNFVFMGIGEPFDNFDNIKNALQIMNDKNGFNIAARRITISTSGIVSGIEAIKNINLQINLAVSLHTANQAKRKSIMPIAEKYTITQLSRACKNYFEKTNRIITFEYMLLKGINDSKRDAFELANFAKDHKAKVNIISYNPAATSNKYLKVPNKVDINRFYNILVDKGVSVTVRNSKGNKIKAACGQLAGKIKI